MSGVGTRKVFEDDRVRVWHLDIAPGEEVPRMELASGEAFVLAVCAFFVLVLGIFPNEGSLPLLGQLQVVDWARDSVRLLFPSS